MAGTGVKRGFPLSAKGLSVRAASARRDTRTLFPSALPVRSCGRLMLDRAEFLVSASIANS